MMKCIHAEITGFAKHRFDISLYIVNFLQQQWLTHTHSRKKLLSTLRMIKYLCLGAFLRLYCGYANRWNQKLCTMYYNIVYMPFQYFDRMKNVQCISWKNRERDSVWQVCKSTIEFCGHLNCEHCLCNNSCKCFLCKP